jgi:hypothetical protein
LVERLSKLDKYLGLRIPRETWKKIRELEKTSVDALSSQLAKKLAHHSRIFGRLSAKEIPLLVASDPETPTKGADLIESGLLCPACKTEALAAFQDFDADVEDGEVIGASMIPTMSCRVCGLELAEDDIQHIIENFEEYLGDNEEEEEFWIQSIEVENSANDY